MLRFCILMIAVLAFSAAVSAQTTPQTHDEFVRAGQAEAQKGNFAGAAAWYSKAINVQKDDFDIIYARSGCYMVIGKYDDALKDINTVLKGRPGNNQVLLMRANLYNAKTDWKKGLADAEAVLAADADLADGYQTRGLAKAGLKKFAEAEADLAEAIRRNPRNPMYYTVRAAIYEQQGKAGPSQADKLKAESLKRGQ